MQLFFLPVCTKLVLNYINQARCNQQVSKTTIIIPTFDFNKYLTKMVFIICCYFSRLKDRIISCKTWGTRKIFPILRSILCANNYLWLTRKNIRKLICWEEWNICYIALLIFHSTNYRITQLKGDRLKTFFRKKKCSGITKVFLIIKPWLKLVPVFGKQDMVNKMYFYFQKVLLNIK